MGCSFRSNNKNELSFIPKKNYQIKDINVESSNISIEESCKNTFHDNNNSRIKSMKFPNISPIKNDFNPKIEKEEEYIIFLLNKLSSNIKGFLFRKKYEDYLKTQLMDHTNELYFQFIFLTKNYRSSKILNNKENEKLNNIMKISWKDFYKEDPTITIQNKIKKIKKYNNGFIFKYKHNNFDSNNIEQCLKNVESCYKGSVELINNKKCGYGELIQINGTQEIGSFYNDEFNGWNTYIKDNGLLYVGLFKNGVLNGHGVCFDSEKEYTYKGIFKDFQKEDYGVEYSKGNKYIGEFKKDKKCGKGEMIFQNKDIYIGEFHNDLINGYGKYIWSNNNKKYEGNFLNGRINGNGFLQWGKNYYYKGFFNNGIKEGKGEIGYLNEKQFFFEFKNNLPFGDGFFINNNKKNIVIYYQGRIIDKYTNEIIFIFE